MKHDDEQLPITQHRRVVLMALIQIPPSSELISYWNRYRKLQNINKIRLLGKEQV